MEGKGMEWKGREGKGSIGFVSNLFQWGPLAKPAKHGRFFEFSGIYDSS